LHPDSERDLDVVISLDSRSAKVLAPSLHFPKGL